MTCFSDQVSGIKRRPATAYPFTCQDRPLTLNLTSDHLTGLLVFDDLVVMARGNTPDPIPNSAVKTLSADGTAS